MFVQFQTMHHLCLLQPDDNQLAIIFMKVDANCDGTVDWVSSRLIHSKRFDCMKKKNSKKNIKVMVFLFLGGVLLVHAAGDPTKRCYDQRR